jgi:hypothetical protein
MSGAQASAYGNICSTCRKTALENAEIRKKTDAEGGSTSIESGHKLDAKTKVHSAIDMREERERIEKEYHEERKIDENTSSDIHETKKEIETHHKKHRDEFLKNRHFLSGDRKAPAPSITPAKSTDEAALTSKNNASSVETTESKFEERKKTEHDFTVAHQGQQIAGQIRFSGQAYQQFRQWLGNSAPIVRNLNQTLKEVAPKNPGAIAEPAKELQHKELKAGKESEKLQTNPATEFIENNWRPGSKR